MIKSTTETIQGDNRSGSAGYFANEFERLFEVGRILTLEFMNFVRIFTKLKLHVKVLSWFLGFSVYLIIEPFDRIRFDRIQVPDNVIQTTFQGRTRNIHVLLQFINSSVQANNLTS